MFLVNICLQISLVETMIRHQTLHLAIVTRKETMRFFFSDYDLSCRESFTVALSHRIKKEKIINARSKFAVSRYKGFMKNKNIIRTFCGYKPSKKDTLSHQSFTSSNKKAQRHWMNSKIHKISKGKKVNKLGQNFFDQHKV